jgi:hypothetical protein
MDRNKPQNDDNRTVQQSRMDIENRDKITKSGGDKTQEDNDTTQSSEDEESSENYIDNNCNPGRTAR